MITYKLGRIPGPTGIYTGYIIMVFGAFALYFTLISLVLIVAGVALAFSFSEIMIDPVHKKYKHNIRLFGILNKGPFKDFQSNDEVLMKHLKGNFYIYSRTEKKYRLSRNDYRVYIIRNGERRKTIAGRFTDEKEALQEMDIIKGLIQSVKNYNKEDKGFSSEVE